ncbi:MAG: alpha-mannosidase [candidate division Zixibacteria bacterium]|nr:alpha-mannosidase [candidate division Zixibacteria bacterium]
MKQQIRRVERFIDRITDKILGEKTVLDASFSRSKTPVPFNNRLDQSYIPIQEGEIWGASWESAWFHLEGVIPEQWRDQKIVAHLDFSGEGLVCRSNGELIQGITNGSVFKEDFSRDLVPLIDKCQGGEQIELWVETAANSLFGVFTEPDPKIGSPNRYGHYDAKVNSMKLAVFDTDLWKLWLDFKIVLGLIKTLPENSVRRLRLLGRAGEAIDTYAENRDNLEKCRQILLAESKKPASTSDLTVLAVGHAHIDTAWLWPVKETIRKCARTFASQLSLIEKYPDYVFGASQPQHYAFIKKHYPDLYAKIRKAVKAGRIEPQGGMWVESDCNLPGGESLIRQILHGKNFFKDEFGIEVNNLWLPDAFGYSAALPQIMKKSDIDYFLSQKLSWNQTNDFPYHTFKWRGIDGTEVLAHFPPENTYNSQLGTDFLVPAQTNFKERDYLDEFISLFGVGDGGGGPKEENIELGVRMADLEGSPKVRFGKASDFFDRLKKYTDLLPTWVGELYLELHRGTFTSQASVKKANRQLEHRLKAVEFIWSCLPLEQYPAERLDSIWKNVLMNQFHDILPGSSITEVYKVTHAEHEEALRQCDSLLSAAANELFTKDNQSLVLFNSLHYRYNEPVELPDTWRDSGIADDEGNSLPLQVLDGRLYTNISIEPYSFKTIKKTDSKPAILDRLNNLILENDIVRYEFAQDGTIIDARDKLEKRAILEDGRAGNIFTLYDDHPNDWDAWDIDITYEKSILENARTVKTEPLAGGPIIQGIRFTLGIGNSKIKQDVRLAQNSKRLDFVTTVDWQEKHKMLRVAFPVNVQADQASYDIQYGFLKRNTHRNTSWDEAKFEVVGHRYVDLSNNNFGVALLNDCKYGHKVHKSVLDLNLLRSPTYPDPDADQGRHHFTYSLLPHSGDLIHSDVIANAAHLNQGILIFEGYKTKNKTLPCYLTGNGLSLEVIKRAEKEDCLILRIVETKGRASTGILTVEGSRKLLIETNLMEWDDAKELIYDKPIKISLKPFEIRTYKLKG